MCQFRSRKRPRTASNSSPGRVHEITPDHSATPTTAAGYESSSSADAYSNNDSEAESDADADTSFESPATSSSSYESLSTPWSASSPIHKRTKTCLTQDHRAATDELSVLAALKPLSAHRDEIVAAILTIASALGLTKETLHVCVDLLDRYLAAHTEDVDAARLERLSIACLWIAVKFIETPETIAKKSIKQILKRRRHSGNWTWLEILRQETEILRVLNFRVMAPTVLNTLQAKLHADGGSLSSEQRQLAFYFADLLLLKDRANAFAKELLVDAIWFVVAGNQIADVQAPLLAPVVILFLAHRDNINPKHAVYKTWFALRCQFGPFLQAPWQLPFDPRCECRVCDHTSELAATMRTAAPANAKRQAPATASAAAAPSVDTQAETIAPSCVAAT